MKPAPCPGRVGSAVRWLDRRRDRGVDHRSVRLLRHDRPEREPAGGQGQHGQPIADDPAGAHQLQRSPAHPGGEYPSVGHAHDAVGIGKDPIVVGDDDDGRAAARARCRRRSRMTAEPVSLSSEAVGSSQISSRGSWTSARPIATRCCWPPDSSLGSLSRCPPSCSRSSTAPAADRARLGAMPRTSSGTVTFSIAVSAGRRLKVWNTRPRFCERKRARRAPRKAPRSVSQDPHLATVGAKEAGDGRDQRGLAAAGRADQEGQLRRPGRRTRARTGPLSEWARVPAT